MYRMIITAVVLFSAATLGLNAQGKPPKNTPPSYPATASFRCDSQMPEPLPAECRAAIAPEGTDEGFDRVRGDAGEYAYLAQWRSGGTNYTAGSWIPSLQQFQLRLLPGTAGVTPDRFLSMELGDPLVLVDPNQPAGAVRYAAPGELPCAALDNCSPTGRPAGAFALNDVFLIVKPLIPGTLDDWVQGLAEMACDGTPVASIAAFTFPDANGNGHWGLNFNPRGQPESSPLQLVRTGLQRWVIQAQAAHRAILIGFGHSGIRGKQGPSREGLYRVPFEIEVTTEGAMPARAGCS